MVDHVESNGPPPEELTSALRCRRWGVLPGAGGMDDQPLRLLPMDAALSTFNAFQARMQATRTQKATNFSRDYPEIIEFCEAIERWLDED